MAGETKNDAVESATNTDTKISPTKKKKGVLSRIWNALFRLRGDDFEKRLQYITKEEASVLARIKRRSHSSRRIARNLIILTVVFEVKQPILYSIIVPGKYRILVLLVLLLRPNASLFLQDILNCYCIIV